MNTCCGERIELARRGSALLASLIVVMVVAVLATAYLQVAVRSGREGDRRLDEERAYYLAEAGVAEAVHALRRGGSGEVGSAESPATFGDGLLWVEAEDAGDGQTLLTVAALSGGGRRSIQALAAEAAGSDSPFGAAIFSGESLTVESSTVIDSFDSALGTYAQQLAEQGGDHLGDAAVVSSNGDITVDNSARIYGSVQPGPDGAAFLFDPDVVTGGVAPLEEPRVLDPVTAPDLPTLGDLAVPNKGEIVVKAGDSRYGDVSIGGQGRLVLQGPGRIVLNDLDVSSNAELVLDAEAGPLEVYVQGHVSLASNSVIGTPGAAANLTLYLVGSADQVADLSSNSDFCGAVYGAEARVLVKSNFRLYGSVVAREVVLSANVNVHYDESLASAGGAGGESFELVGLRRSGFPLPEAARDHRDPSVVLDVIAGELDSLSDAALEPQAGFKVLDAAKLHAGSKSGGLLGAGEGALESEPTAGAGEGTPGTDPQEGSAGETESPDPGAEPDAGSEDAPGNGNGNGNGKDKGGLSFAPGLSAERTA